MTYSVEVSRQGRWWMVSIPDIDGLTQSTRLVDAGPMAREYIAVTLDVPIENVEVEVQVLSVGPVSVADRVAAIRADREEATRLDREASRLAVELARELAAQKIPLRDVGTILGVSHQRAHQLISR